MLLENRSQPRLLLAAISRRLPGFRGKTSALRSLDRRLAAIDRQAIVAGVRGVQYELRTRDLIDFSVLYMGGYGPEMVDYLVERLQIAAETVFWDVGANVGAVSLPVAQRVPGARVVSFEPSPAVFPRLHRNIALNPELRSRVTAVDTALGDNSGTATFYVSNEDFNSGVGGLAPAHNRAGDGVEVEIARGDDIVASGKLPAPHVIKIDAEGGEAAVLAGLRNVLSAPGVHTVLFEHSLYRLRDAGTPLDHNANVLRDHGFRLLRLTPGGAKPLRDDDLKTDCDIAAER